MAIGRAHYSSYLIDLEGQPLGEATVTLYNQGTTTPITPTIYANDTDGTTKANPMTASATGKIEFYLAAPGRYSMKVEKSGYTTTTEVIDVLFSTVGSAHLIREDGVAQTVRGALMFFGNDFDLSDDAVDNETVLAIATAIARKSGTNTWTGVNTFSAAAVFNALGTFATGGALGAKVGTAVRLIEISNELYLTLNAEFDGANWVRLRADVDASLITLQDDGSLVFQTNSDSNNTVGSTITFVDRFKITTAGLIVTEAWIAPTLEGSWANTAGKNPAGYWKDPFGVVHLRGALDSGVNSTTIFTLPAGYRPPNQETRYHGYYDGVGHDAGLITITAAGAVSFGSSHGFGAGALMSLDGVTFKTT